MSTTLHFEGFLPEISTVQSRWGYSRAEALFCGGLSTTPSLVGPSTESSTQVDEIGCETLYELSYPLADEVLALLVEGVDRAATATTSTN